MHFICWPGYGIMPSRCDIDGVPCVFRESEFSIIKTTEHQFYRHLFKLFIFEE